MALSWTHWELTATSRPPAEFSNDLWSLHVVPTVQLPQDWELFLFSYWDWDFGLFQCWKLGSEPPLQDPHLCTVLINVYVATGDWDYIWLKTCMYSLPFLPMKAPRWHFFQLYTFSKDTKKNESLWYSRRKCKVGENAVLAGLSKSKLVRSACLYIELVSVTYDVASPDPDPNPRGRGQLPNPKSAILR